MMREGEANLHNTYRLRTYSTVLDRNVLMRTVAVRNHGHLPVEKWLGGGLGAARGKLERAGDGKDWRSVGRVGRWYG